MADTQDTRTGRASRDAPEITDIRLEFLRGGPAHNQLLSPLTPYMALCGADGPVDVHVPFEHAQLLTRLNRLRYEIDGVAVSQSQREAELRELGEAIARMLGKIPALVSDLRAARHDTSRLVNIQLKISAFELSLVPFETTMAPADTSGSGAPLLLRTLTSLTREIRRGEPLAVDWNRKPRILFVFASPDGLPAVPAQDHVDALRRAIEPWVGIRDSSGERIADVRKMLTVLKNASIGKISAECQANDYTHVHILAHGAPMPDSENRRFGICLAKENDPGGYVVVDGQSLAIALKSMNTNGKSKPPPTVVTLATCDSGNTGSVLTPGGSIAHELHAEDIPWVIASQFPLWMRASSVGTEVLYKGLLAGTDPRWVLHELRQRLRIDLPETHDWASIVAYAAIGADLETQVDAFHTRQTKSGLEVKFDRMDELVGMNEPDPKKRKARDAAGVADELSALCMTVRADLSAWCDEPIALRSPKEHAERLGMRAASEKRIGIAYSLFYSQGTVGEVPSTSPEFQAAAKLQSDQAYRLSRQFYAEALKAEPANHWVITQFLSMIATPALAAGQADLDTAASLYGRWWEAARQLAQWDTNGGPGGARAWAHSTLAELELLGAVYSSGADTLELRQKAIVAHCLQVCELAGSDPFPVASTQRQFRRYIDHWSRPEWLPLAQTAVDALDRCKRGY